MAEIGPVTPRPLARRVATVLPARSICDNSQPPKISPAGLASAGIAMARSAGSDCGGASDASLALIVGFSWALRSQAQLRLVEKLTHLRPNAGLAQLGEPECMDARVLIGVFDLGA